MNADPPTGSPAGGLIIAAPSSGSGKTLVTLGLLRHFRNLGVAVAAAKSGPDYIDPAFHQAACGRPSQNLDPWAMRECTLGSIANGMATGADNIICEGVMGLFDGANLRGDRTDGSTAALAEITGWPVVLVIDAARQAASAAVIAGGLAAHRPSVNVIGVIFNKVGSDNHARILTQAMESIAPDLKVFGALPRTPELALPSRHLGLVQAREHPDLETYLERAAGRIGAHLDITGLRRAMRPWSVPPRQRDAAMIPPLGQRIAVAWDDAFAFCYPALLESWRDAGTEIDFFSPLCDETPPETADAVYLPGGYPELFAGRLTANGKFLDGLRRAGDAAIPILGECGGYMVLGHGLTDADGQRHLMAGLLPLETDFAARSLHLGYRRATLLNPGPLGGAGTRYRGHEFHYASIVDEGPGEALFGIEDACGNDIGGAGMVNGHIMGSFIHLIDAESIQDT